MVRKEHKSFREVGLRGGKSVKKRRGWQIVAGVVLLALMGLVGVYLALNKELEGLRQEVLQEPDLLALEDGSYEGDFDAKIVSAKVRVEIKDHQITKIILLEHRNGQGKAAEALPQKVVEGQSLQVDLVSGATYSSIVILKAIEEALTGP
ncbi:FMN-binding protein [Proteiniclasticum sp. BAD-10]|uniref:FMN-binding protein n=1 Tax=Proteiniclasticum sediminis TaxID=2804028 RepID=A0A941CPM8_9CLOT|nr:FMN-binding protein [Proteiniclasticum sediminis]